MKPVRILLRKTLFVICLFVSAFGSATAWADELKPFTTDGCSAFPDGTTKHRALWMSCCIAHDLSYWQGGTYAERLEADRELEQCVTQVGKPEIAKIMLAGVRVGGSPYYPMPYRWGYGWSWPRGYGELSAVEKQQVSKKLQEFEILIQHLFSQLKDRNSRPEH